jgi:hypothetical protein
VKLGAQYGGQYLATVPWLKPDIEGCGQRRHLLLAVIEPPAIVDYGRQMGATIENRFQVVAQPSVINLTFRNAIPVYLGSDYFGRIADCQDVAG